MLAAAITISMTACGSTAESTASTSETASVSETSSVSESAEATATPTAEPTEEAASTSESEAKAATSATASESSSEEETPYAVTPNIKEAKAVEVDEEALAAFETLFETALDCAAKEDKDAFTALFKDPDDETISSIIDSYYDYYSTTYITDDFPDTGYSILWGNGTYYMGFVLNTLCEGEYPDTTYTSHCGYLAFSHLDDEWLFDYTTEARSTLNSSETSEALYPEGMYEAAVNGRNAVDFSNSDFSWINMALVVPGTVDSKVYLAWQNEDGSVTCLLNVKNGTDQEYTISTEDFKLADDDLGTIFIADTGSLGTIAPGQARNFLLSVGAADVLTGTEVWESPTVQCIGTIE